jgi:hypothetical protein
MTSSSERVYLRRPDTVAANLGRELAVLDLPTASYLGFNETAAHVWRLLSEPRTLDALCDAMVEEFDIDENTCRVELIGLLDNLQTANLIRCKDA